MAKKSKKHPNIPPVPVITSIRTNASDAWESIRTTLRLAHSRQQLPKVPWLEKEWETGFEDYYVDLTIRTKCENAKPLRLHEIFDSHELPTHILIEGPAGYGKSTIACKLCFDHAKNKSYIRHFDAVFLFRLREFNGMLEQTIIDTLELENFSAELVMEILTQNQSKIAFILDGFDELHQKHHPQIIPLLTGKHYPQSTVIVTSRMGNIKLEGEKPDSSVTNLLDCMESRISIIGVTGENTLAFLQLYLKGYSSKMCDSFIKSTDKRFGLSKVTQDNLFSCPLYLLLLVIVAEETDLTPLTSKTQLYKQLFNFILRRTLAKEGQVDPLCDFFDFTVDNPPAYVEMLFRFGSFAGDALTRKQYSFTEEEILRACGNDTTILKLGILTHNDSKIGPRRKTWLESIHVSFLEFALAYSIWVGCVSTHPFLPFNDSINMVNLSYMLSRSKLVVCFICGLCWKQLPTSLPAFMMDSMNWLNQEEMMAESHLKLSELGKTFLPLIPVEFTVDIREELPILLKEALMHAVQTRRHQRIILKQVRYFSTEQHQGSWLKVTTRVNSEISCLDSVILQDWRELTTSQDIEFAEMRNCMISYPSGGLYRITLTIPEAPFQEQLRWLSDFMTSEVIRNKPMRNITYECSSENLPKLIVLMTDLIRQERVTGVTFQIGKFSECPSAESWKKFIHCANESKALLELNVIKESGCNNAEPSLGVAVDLTPMEGKQWRKVVLQGNVVLSVGSQLVDVSKVDKYSLDSLLRSMPSNIQFLNLAYACHNMFNIYVFRNDNLPLAHNVEELVILFSRVRNLSFLQSCMSESLKNLRVLKVAPVYGLTCSENESLITFLLSMISHCNSLVRIEFPGVSSCTQLLIVPFLESLSKDPALSDRGDSVSTNLHLNTLMIYAPDKKSVLTTGNLVKDALQTGCIKHLWVRCTKADDGYEIRKFMELFSPAEFNIKAVDKQLWSKHNLEYGREIISILEVSVK